MAVTTITKQININFEDELHRDIFLQFWDDFQFEYYMRLPNDNVNIQETKKNNNLHIIDIKKLKRSIIKFTQRKQNDK